jgi:hypothetical protein
MPIDLVAIFYEYSDKYEMAPDGVLLSWGKQYYAR